MSESWNEKWEIQQRLGEGGQGTVDLVVSSEHMLKRSLGARAIIESIGSLTRPLRDQEQIQVEYKVAEQLANAIQRAVEPPLPCDLGALKQLHVPTAPADREQAMNRFAAELRVLGELRNRPGILNLLDGNQSEGWMVTEYYPGGTLAQHPRTFAGDAVRALRAFEPIVAAVASLHERSIIHRDIKPANIFLSASNELVLGDFGIVFWADEHQARLTHTYGERVGSRDWMAPWANRGERLAEINPTFDLFPLGKLLWAMVSGRRELPYWYWHRDEHNLERLFPDDGGMYWINTRILKHTIVEQEQQCLASATELLQRVQAVRSLLERGGQRLTAPRPCRICGIGHYGNFRGGESQIIAMVPKPVVPRVTEAQSLYREEDTRVTVRAQVCDECGHVEFFHFESTPPAWEA